MQQIYTVIGYRETEKNFNYENGGYDYSNCFDFLLKNENGQKFILKIGIEIGDCPSGYTSASYLHSKLILVDNFGPFNYQSNDILNITIPSDGNIVHSISTPFLEIDIYDDYYYPNASISINNNCFNFVQRASLFKNKVIYLISGDSGLGKSTFAMKAFGKVLETDNKSFFDNVSSFDYDCIVFGKNISFTVDNFLNIYQENSNNISFVLISFQNI